MLLVYHPIVPQVNKVTSYRLPTEAGGTISSPAGTVSPSLHDEDKQTGWSFWEGRGDRMRRYGTTLLRAESAVQTTWEKGWADENVARHRSQ